jgi:heme/copper-type cytochrome/quinol oxidase subunit 2
MLKRLQFGLFIFALTAWSLCDSQSNPSPSPRVIELTADRDSRYRQGHKASPTLEVLAGEPLTLRITAVRAKEVARDGSVHGLALLDKNANTVAGWRFFLHPGVQDLAVTAPSEPGRYTAVCTVICSDTHDGMAFTLLVIDPKTSAKE